MAVAHASYRPFSQNRPGYEVGWPLVPRRRRLQLKTLVLVGARCLREQFFPWFDVALVWIFTFTNLDLLRADVWCFLWTILIVLVSSVFLLSRPAETWTLPSGYKPPGHLGKGEAYGGTFTV